MSALSRILRRPANVLLLALNFLLLGSLLGSLVHPWRAELPPPEPLGSLPALPVGTTAAASLGEDYATLIARPVFHRDRTYTPPPKAESVVVQTPLPDYVVTGYMAVPGRPGKAFLRERSAGRSLAVAVGDAVDGWTVAQVGPRQVELRQGQRTALLMRSGPPVEGSSSVRDAPAPEARKPPTEPAQSKEASPVPLPPPMPAASGAAPPYRPVAAPLPSTAPPPGAPREQPQPHPSAPHAEAAPATMLTTVTVTPPRQFGPPLLVEPRGPLLTYVPPAKPEAN